MGDKATTEQLHKAKKRREEWMKLMKDISEPLNDEIVKQKKKRQELYVAILEQGWKIHLARASKRPSDVQITKDLKEVTKKAEDYTIVECKLIAFEEIDKLCQEIGNDFSFLADHKGNVKLDGSASAAVASVIYASHYCEKKLREMTSSSEGENLKKKLEKVRNMLADYFGGGFELQAEHETKQMTPKIKENLVKQPDPKKILEKVATVNHLRIM